MNRRTILASSGVILGGALAGCTGIKENLSNSDTSPTDGEKEDTEGDKSMLFSIGAVKPNPDPLAGEITVISGRLDASEFPRVKIAIENRGNEPMTWEDSSPESVFPPVLPTPSGGLQFGKAENFTDRLMDAEGCARTETRLKRDAIARETTLEAGESMEEEYGLVGVDSELEHGCPEPGTYELSYEYDDIGTWGFEFRLKV